MTPEARAFGLGSDSDRIERDFGRSLRELEPRLREIEPRLRELEPRLREFRYNGPMDFNFDFVPGWSSPRSRLGVQLEELTAATGGVLRGKEWRRPGVEHQFGFARRKGGAQGG